MGDRGKGKWIRGESFVSTRGECAKESACIHVHGKSWHQCRVSHSLARSLSLSLSLSLSSLSEIRIIQRLFLNVSAEYL
jgi:hypothetical protein